MIPKLSKSWQTSIGIACVFLFAQIPKIVLRPEMWGTVEFEIGQLATLITLYAFILKGAPIYNLISLCIGGGLLTASISWFAALAWIFGPLAKVSEVVTLTLSSGVLSFAIPELIVGGFLLYSCHVSNH